MHTPARFKILQELQELKSLLKNLTCGCSDNNAFFTSNHSTNNSEKTAEFLITLNLFQLAIMIGLVIALMCNFYSIRKPGWQEIAFKALSFGLIVTFWPIYLFILIVMTCYSKCIKEDEEEVKNFRARYMSASGPTFRLLESVILVGFNSFNFQKQMLKSKAFIFLKIKIV